MRQTMNGTRDWLRLVCVVAIGLALMAGWTRVALPRVEPVLRVLEPGQGFDDGGVHVELRQMVVTRSVVEEGERPRSADQPPEGYVLVAALVEGRLLGDADSDLGCVFALRMSDGDVVNPTSAFASVCHEPQTRQRWITFVVAPDRVPLVEGLQLQRGPGAGEIHLLRPAP